MSQRPYNTPLEAAELGYQRLQSESSDKFDPIAVSFFVYLKNKHDNPMLENFWTDKNAVAVSCMLRKGNSRYRKWLKVRIFHFSARITTFKLLPAFETSSPFFLTPSLASVLNSFTSFDIN